MPRRNFILILAVAVFSIACYRASDRNPYGRYFSDVMNKVDQLYVDPVDNEALFDSAVKGMLQNLDKHSTFFGPREASQFLSLIDQQYGGIGIEVSGRSENRATQSLGHDRRLAGLRSRHPGGRSNRQNRRPPDRRHEPRGRHRPDPRRDRHAGAIGNCSRRRDEPLVLSLKRAEVQVDSVLGDTRKDDDSWDFHLQGHPDIGYIRIRTFGDRTLQELLPAVTALKNEHVKGLIIDLRFDPGGRSTRRSTYAACSFRGARRS